MRTIEFLKGYNEHVESMNEAQEKRKAKLLQEQVVYEKTRDDINSIKEQRESSRKAYFDFSSKVKKSLLSEALLTIFNKSLGTELEYFKNEAFKISLVNKFIDEQGSADNLLYHCKGRSLLLSEINRSVQTSYKAIMEKANQSDPTTLIIDVDDKDNFFDSLDLDSIEDVADQIKTRVANAIDAFMQDNINDKMDIKDIMQSTEEKINGVQDSTDGANEIKEQYEARSKRQITNIRNKRKRTIFEQIVRNVAESSIKDKALKELYTENGKLNMDKIIESCRVMYTLLEMVNTMKIINVNEEYLESVLEGLNA